ncbi:primosomal protein N' [Akkermansiaceae bacterium]|nr:primosomal protein N' [Akkermansiaceae bacterium]MDA7612508.1 primosomal protein N' [bacterium]MDA7526721.1 primosomal protein N' [Akkermansiaceae bacterium]MDA7630447.1 primosomal protein N' [bacterium]MDA7639626.1 primosomal protein N' [Akkermansiaceae bacterium]
MPLAASVIIDGPSELVFDYAIPDHLKILPGCRVRIPLRNRDATGTVLRVQEAPQSEFDLRYLTGLVDPEPLITPALLKLAEWITSYYGTPLEQVIRSIIPASIRGDKTSAKIRKAAILAKKPTEIDLAKLAKRAKRQHQIITLLSIADKPIPITELGGASTSSSIKTLAAKGWVKVINLEVRRDPDANETFLPTDPLTLNEEQDEAYQTISKSLHSEKPKPILLHGITGSGKTEVYLQATRTALKLGKNVIILVPEISLAPQTVQRFKARFHDLTDQIAILHSNLSQGERFDEWHRIRAGKARIVIGARSAIFAPVKDPGLIIVDEEHEPAYKQENPPKYHARDLAVVRCNLEKCTVVLGSATPSLETFQNTQLKKYQIVKLTERADGASLPLTRVVDMRIEAKKHKGRDAIISDVLRTSVEKRIEANEQVIIFLNRRGFARSLQCPPCGHVIECNHCSIPLTYHRGDERLVCHVCGFQSIVPRLCPNCQDPAIRFQGYGTEKAETILRKVFPSAKIARLDTDTTRRKNTLRDTLRDFRAKKINILLGTQMIAKGLDFPNVTLVGVLNADLSLYAPDFRAGERTFQLLTQVAGRAGRGKMAGEVIIQTSTPHSPSIQFARHHDFDGFVAQELNVRQQFQYPPFTHLALLLARSSHERRAEFTLQTLHRKLAEDLPDQVILGDPIPSPLTKSHSQFRFQLLMRGPNARILSHHLNKILRATPTPEDVIVTGDLDAYDLG